MRRVIKSTASSSASPASLQYNEPQELPRGQYFSANDPNDVAFFSNVSQRIAENLLYHVDGKATGQQQAVRRSTKSTQSSSIDLSFYNFPAMTPMEDEEEKRGFMKDICYLERSYPVASNADQSRERKLDQQNVKRKLQSLPQDKQEDLDQPFDLSMSSSRALAAVMSFSLNEKQTTNSTTDPTSNATMNPETVSKRQRNEDYICTVCGHISPSRLSFFDHAKNNHPNSSYSYIILEEGTCVPAHLLTWRYDSPQGVLKSCDVSFYPSNMSSSQTSSLNDVEIVKCTRCSASFSSRSLLREHIFVCAKKARRLQKQMGYSESKSNTNVVEQETSKSLDYTTRSGKKRSNDTSPSVSLLVGKPTASISKKKVKRKSSNSTFETTDTTPTKTTVSHVTLTNDAVEAAMKALSPTLKASVPVKESENDEEETTTSETQPPTAPKIFIKKCLVCKKCGKKFAFKDALKKHFRTCKNKTNMTRKFKSLLHLNQDQGNDLRRRTRNSLRNQAKDQTEMVIKNEKEEESRTKKQKQSSDEQQETNETAEDQLNQEEEEEETIDEQEKPSPENINLLKQDHPLVAFKGSPAQHHSCPYCQRGFTYLANFRKHIKAICPIKQQMEDQKRMQQEVDNDANDAPTSTTSTNNTSNSYSLSSDGTKSRFKTFSCGVCHKIYFSYLELLKHRLSHKLSGEEGNGNGNNGSSSVQETASSTPTNTGNSDEERKMSTDSDELLSLEEQAARQALALTHVSDRRRRSSAVAGRASGSSPGKGYASDSQQKLTQFRTRLQAQIQAEQQGTLTRSLRTRTVTSAPVTSGPSTPEKRGRRGRISQVKDKDATPVNEPTKEVAVEGIPQDQAPDDDVKPGELITGDMEAGPSNSSRENGDDKQNDDQVDSLPDEPPMDALFDDEGAIIVKKEPSNEADPPASEETAEMMSVEDLLCNNQDKSSPPLPSSLSGGEPSARSIAEQLFHSIDTNKTSTTTSI